MFCIGLTGGIGSGKTTIANFFAELGVAIIDCDLIAREITQPGQTAFNAIVKHFGNDILTKNQELDRKKLREIIFKNFQERKWIEHLLHPSILAEILVKIKLASSPYCIIVIPLLAENIEQFSFLDRICVVETPDFLCKQWAANRDQTSISEILKIMETQNSSTQRRNIANDIIYNENGLDALKEQISRLHELYLNLAKTTPSN